MEYFSYAGKIHLLKALYNKIFSTVRVDGEFTDWFQTVVDVLQGCVLSPILFCVFLEDVAARALGMEDVRVVVSGSRISNLKFADDIALTAESQKELQSMIDRVVTKVSGLA